ncbi:MAG: hypothetical protein H6642_03435 [Caldilineaceae bacterium]|nr:hypothetical protein [Caldilineaceae bacterium]
MTPQQSDPDSSNRINQYVSDIRTRLPATEEQRHAMRNGLIIGGLIGLLVGWFVLGWFLFPVRLVVNADQLTEKGQADYISAVADAYAARQDDEALRLAAYRLRTYIGNEVLNEALSQTVSYFNANAMPDTSIFETPVDFNSRVRVNNIYGLAADLSSAYNLPINDFLVETGMAADDASATAAQTDAATAQNQTQTETGAVGSSSARSPRAFWTRLVQLLVAILLIFGGLWLIRWLRRRMDASRADGVQDSWSSVEEFPHDRRDVIMPGERQASSAQAYQGREDRNQAAYDDRYTASYDDREYEAREADVVIGDEFDEHGEPPSTLRASVDPREYADYSFSDEDAGEEYDVVDGEYRPVQVSRERYAADDEPAWPDDIDQIDEVDEIDEVAVETKRAASPLPTRQTRREEAATRGDYTFHYPAGVEEYEYDESYTISDHEGRVIGSCGMGVNLQNGSLKSDPSRVIALDSWMFDKVDTSRPDDYRRTLISEYVVNQGLEKEFNEESGKFGAPIVAQPGIEYRLEGKNLIMLCKILDVTYDKDGLFKQVKVNARIIQKD